MAPNREDAKCDNRLAEGAHRNVSKVDGDGDRNGHCRAHRARLRVLTPASVRRSLPCLGAFSGASSGCAGSPVSAGAATPATLTVVGQSSLGACGTNAALTVAGSCAYIGSRNDAASRIVDGSNPASPLVTGQLTKHPGSTP